MKVDLIVTRHAGLVAWLHRHHPELQGVPIVSHVNGPEEVRGKVILGNLPLHLAAEASAVVAPTFAVPAGKRGEELTAEELDILGVHLVTYKVTRVDAEE